MKIAIHHREGSFSEQWIKYCKDNEISYKIVDCYRNDIMSQLEDCNALMWHYSHLGKETLFAKQILFTAEQIGLKVFPNFRTGWHYDDKIGQKYLLDSVKEYFIPTYIFYDKKEALTWAQNTDYPKVFKLRGGAGSMNVELVSSERKCLKIIKKSFGRGIKQYSGIRRFKEYYMKYQDTRNFKYLLKGVGRFFIKPKQIKAFQKEQGYVYFQEFLDGNDFDMRVIVIGNRAYGMKRLNRKNDFRASGSSQYLYDALPNDVLSTAFLVTKKLGLQCVAFDFVYDQKDNPLIIEMSFAFGTKGSSKCSGYWDEELNWYEDKFNPQGGMVENLIVSE